MTDPQADRHIDAQDVKIKALVEAADALKTEWATHQSDGKTYQVVNAGNEVWHNFLASLAAARGPK